MSVRERLRSQRGAGFVAVLAALLIAAVLYFGYFGMQRTTSERSTGTTAIDASRAFACRTNRQTIERQITSWIASHGGDVPTLDDLDAEVGPLPECPEGGRYSLSGRVVSCSEHP